MKHGFRALAVALQLAVLLGWQVDRAAAQVTETYLFRDSFAPIEGAGNVLVPVSNGTLTNGTYSIVTSGPTFLNGAFVTETISASACATTPTIRAWSFPVTAGLRYANDTPNVATGAYSISLLMRYNPMDGGYARLIDFSNSMLDTGIYKLGNGVSFYPVGTFAPGSFVSNRDVFVTITRSATTKLVSLYINGVASGTYTDTNNLYAPSATVLYFLMDNTTGSAAVQETDPGVIAYLQIRDTAMTPQEVAASLSGICDAVSCGDGLVTGGEGCDDGNTIFGDGCSADCAVETCWQCSGGPSTCTPLAADTACPPDGDPCTDDVCDGAGTCGVGTCEPSSTTTTSTTRRTTSTSTSSTSTTLPAGCAGSSAGASYESIICRIDALLARVQAEPRLGTFQSKSARSLTQAEARIKAARSVSNAKKARRKLQQAAKALSQYAHRLGSLTARKKLDAAVRTDFQSAGERIAPDVKTLRSQV